MAVVSVVVMVGVVPGNEERANWLGASVLSGSLQPPCHGVWCCVMFTSSARFVLFFVVLVAMDLDVWLPES